MSQAANKVDNYRQALADVAPKGLALPHDPESNWQAILRGLAGSLADFDDATHLAITQWYPHSTTQQLKDWQGSAESPDDCAVDVPVTTQEARAALLSRLRLQGNQTKQKFIELAQEIGYTIDIECLQDTSFRCGVSKVGVDRLVDHNGLFVWKVTIPGPRLSYFRCGVDRLGTPLLVIRRAEDLECLLDRYVAGTVRLVYLYQGA